MRTAVAAAEPPPRPESELYNLVETLSAPAAALVTTLTTGMVRIMGQMIDQADATGFDRGVASVRGERAGDRVTEGGVPGVLVTCTGCSGTGLLFQADGPAQHHTSSFVDAQTAFIAPVSDAQTAVMPAVTDNGAPAYTQTRDRWHTDPGGDRHGNQR